MTRLSSSENFSIAYHIVIVFTAVLVLFILLEAGVLYTTHLYGESTWSSIFSNLSSLTKGNTGSSYKNISRGDYKSGEEL